VAEWHGSDNGQRLDPARIEAHVNPMTATGYALRVDEIDFRRENRGPSSHPFSS